MNLIDKTQKYLHDLFDWGYPEKRVGGDEFQPTYSCKFCDKEVIKDSTGSWFHL
jgi:hypothetical protein